MYLFSECANQKLVQTQEKAVMQTAAQLYDFHNLNKFMIKEIFCIPPPLREFVFKVLLLNFFYNRGVLSFLQLDILPHPHCVLNLDFLPRNVRLFTFSPLDILPKSFNIIGKMMLLTLPLFSRYSFQQP